MRHSPPDAGIGGDQSSPRKEGLDSTIAPLNTPASFLRRTSGASWNLRAALMLKSFDGIAPRS